MSATPWSLGAASDVHSLWINAEENNGTAYRAPRDTALQFAPPPEAGIDAVVPYRHAQLVTVVLSADNAPALIIDGTYVDNVGAADNIGRYVVNMPNPRLVPPNDSGDTTTPRGVFVPLVFSCVLDGNAPPPTEVTVELYQGAEPSLGNSYDDLVRVEHATLVPASDAATEASCHVLPYPVNHVVHGATLQWYERKEIPGYRDAVKSTVGLGSASPGTEWELRQVDLGPLCGALRHIRGVYTDMVVPPSASTAAGATERAKKPATDDYKGMGATHRTLLAYARVDRSITSTDNRFGNGFTPFQRLAEAQPAGSRGTDSDSNKTVAVAKYTMRAEIRVTVYAGATRTGWRLRAPLASSVTGTQLAATMTRERCEIETLVAEIETAALAVTIPDGPLIPNEVVAANMNTFKAYVLNEKIGALFGKAESATVDMPTPTTRLLRVWGALLYRQPTHADPNPRGDEDQYVKEARMATREATRMAEHDFDTAVRRTRAPLRAVSWHSGALPAAATAFATQLTVDTRPLFTWVLPATELGARIDGFCTSGTAPLAVQTSLGAFLPVGATTESEARAALGSEKPADALTRLGLRHTPETEAAMRAFADLVVHEVMHDRLNERRAGMQRGTGPLGDPIDSSVRRAQRQAYHAARLLRSMYVATERTTQMFIRESDPLFVTAQGGRAALVCVRHLPCWMLSATRLRIVDATDATFAEAARAEWPQQCRESASRFCEALARLAKLDKSPVHPVAMPFMALQSLWMWPREISVARVQGTPLIERQRQQTFESTQSMLIPKGVEVQRHAARQSLARVRALHAALTEADLQEVAARGSVRDVIATMVAARPVMVLTSDGDLAQEALLDDATRNELLQETALVVPSTGSTTPDALARGWARRAMDTYTSWRLEAAGRGGEGGGGERTIQDVATALARLSVGGGDGGQGVSTTTQRFYVPFGMSVGASPLAGNNLCVSEMRVWTRGFLWQPVSSSSGFAETTMSVDVNVAQCTPHSRVLFGRAAAHVHPYVLVLEQSDDDSVASVIQLPVCFDEALDWPSGVVQPLASLNALLTASSVSALLRTPHAGRTDRARCIMFTAERLWQTLLLAVARGGSRGVVVQIRLDATIPVSTATTATTTTTSLTAEDQAERTQRERDLALDRELLLLTSLTLAHGMVLNVLPTAPPVRLVGESTRGVRLRTRLAQVAQALANTVPIAPLSEWVAVLAAFDLRDLNEEAVESAARAVAAG